jgi:hypothetical protein
VSISLSLIGRFEFIKHPTGRYICVYIKTFKVCRVRVAYTVVLISDGKFVSLCVKA